MKSRSNVKIAVGVFALFVGLSFGTLVASVDSRPVAVRASEWAVANRATLPSTLERMAPYPAAYRLAAFRQLSPEVRSSLVRAHFALFESRFTLTAEQRQVLNEMLQIVTPEAYVDQGNEEARAKMKPLCQKLSGMLSKEELAAFGTLGVTAPSEPRVTHFARVLKNVVAPYVAEATTAGARQGQKCTCLSTSSCSGCALSGGTCTPGGCSGGIFCGCGFLFSCDGLCYSF